MKNTHILRAPLVGTAGILVATVILLSSCKVTNQDIETWKGTVKGPGKLVAVMMSDKYGPGLRQKAAIALVEMERDDVEGVAELHHALQKMDEKERQDLVDSMVPEIVAILSGEQEETVEEAEEGEEDEDTLSTAEVQAKDAAYVLIPLANGENKHKLVRAVLDWYLADFNGRSLAGNYSAEQVIKSLGPEAGLEIVDVLSSKLPIAALLKMSELVKQVADDKVAQKASVKLIAIHKEMENPAFLKWLKDKIRDQMKGSKVKVTEDRITKAAKLNADNFVNNGALVALKNFADQDVVADHLLDVAANKGIKADPEKRKNALLALEGNAKEKHLSRLLDIALKTETPDLVRDHAFDRVADTQSKAALPKLWPLVQSSSKPRLRWRAGELVLTIGGPEYVQELVGRLPTGRSAEYDASELRGYATRIAQMKTPPKAFLHRQLRAKDWWKRVLALYYFERAGDSGDLISMRMITSDRAKLSGKGWPDEGSVGAVAKQSLDALRTRLNSAKSKKANGSKES